MRNAIHIDDWFSFFSMVGQFQLRFYVIGLAFFFAIQSHCFCFCLVCMLGMVARSVALSCCANISLCVHSVIVDVVCRR